MSNLHEDNREQDALDALIVGAFRGENCDEAAKELADDVTLDAEEKKALDALGPDLVQRIVSGTWRPRNAEAKKRPSPAAPSRLAATAMNRSAAEKDEVSEKAREEIERKVREADALDEREKRTKHDE